MQVDVITEVVNSMTPEEAAGIKMLDPARWLKIWLWNCRHKHTSNVEGLWTLSRDFIYFRKNGGLGLNHKTKKFLALNFDKVVDHKWSTIPGISRASGWLPKPHVLKYVKALTGNVEITLGKSIEMLRANKSLASVDVHIMTKADRDAILSGDFPFNKSDNIEVIQLEVETFWHWNEEVQAYTARIPYRYTRGHGTSSIEESDDSLAGKETTDSEIEIKQRSYALFGPTTWSGETRDRLAASLDGVQWDFVKCWPTIAVDEWKKLGLNVPTWERVLTGEVEATIQDELEIPKQWAKSIVRGMLMTASRAMSPLTIMGIATSRSTNKLIVEAVANGLKLVDISPTLDTLIGELIRERQMGQKAVLKAHPEFLEPGVKQITCFERWLEHEEQTAVSAVSKKLDEAGTHCLTREHDGETRISLSPHVSLGQDTFQLALVSASLTRPLKITSQRLIDKVILKDKLNTLSKSKVYPDMTNTVLNPTLKDSANNVSACPGLLVCSRIDNVDMSIQTSKSMYLPIYEAIDRDNCRSDEPTFKASFKDPFKMKYSATSTHSVTHGHFVLRLRQIFIERQQPTVTESFFMRSLATCARLEGLIN